MATWKKMLRNLGNAFVLDFDYFKGGNLLSRMKKNRYHLHIYVGVAMTLLLLMDKAKVMEMVLWQKLLLIPVVVFGLQLFKEFAWGLLFKITADIRDARMGMYGSFLTVVIVSILASLFKVTDLMLAGAALIVSLYVWYLVKKKKE